MKRKPTGLGPSADTRHASSWRAVRQTDKEIRQEAQAYAQRVPPNVEAQVAAVFLLLAVVTGIAWAIWG